jgi:hypothetical protein
MRYSYSALEWLSRVRSDPGCSTSDGDGHGMPVLYHDGMSQAGKSHRFRVMKRPRGTGVDWVPLDHWFPNLASAHNMARELAANPTNDYAVFDEDGRMIVGPAGDIVEEPKGG